MGVPGWLGVWREQRAGAEQEPHGAKRAASGAAGARGMTRRDSNHGTNGRTIEELVDADTSHTNYGDT